MPFDGTDATLPALQAQAPMVLFDFVTAVFHRLPGLRLSVEGPGQAGQWWIELAAEGMTPAVEWREAQGFGLYGPGPTLPETPRATLACPQAAAARLQRMLLSWQKSAAR
jgi:hypothetical protein